MARLALPGSFPRLIDGAATTLVVAAAATHLLHARGHLAAASLLGKAGLDAPEAPDGPPTPEA